MTQQSGDTVAQEAPLDIIAQHQVNLTHHIIRNKQHLVGNSVSLHAAMLAAWRPLRRRRCWTSSHSTRRDQQPTSRKCTVTCDCVQRGDTAVQNALLDVITQYQVSPAFISGAKRGDVHGAAGLA